MFLGHNFSNDAVLNEGAPEMLLKENQRLTKSLQRADASRDVYRFQLDRLKPEVTEY
jgi:hypothetical protein